MTIIDLRVEPQMKMMKENLLNPLFSTLSSKKERVPRKFLSSH